MTSPPEEHDTAAWEECCDTLTELLVGANLAENGVIATDSRLMSIALSGNQVWALAQAVEFAILNAAIDWPSRPSTPSQRRAFRLFEKKDKGPDGAVNTAEAANSPESAPDRTGA